MKYTLTSPCSNCPFRSDKVFPLTKGRVTELERSLLVGQQTFACHKTTKHCDEDGEAIPHEGEQHCAGALILLEKLNRPNQMMRICERLGMYDRTKLKMDAPVYDTFRQMKTAIAKTHPRA